jgi:hypothetical protein
MYSEYHLSDTLGILMQISKVSGYREARVNKDQNLYIYKTINSLSRRVLLPSDSILPEYAPYAQPNSQTQPIAPPVD